MTGWRGEKIFAALLQTSSVDFPFTASEGPRVPGADPTIPTRSAIVRIETGTARLVYAIGLPLTGPAKEISVAADGTVVFASIFS